MKKFMIVLVGLLLISIAVFGVDLRTNIGADFLLFKDIHSTEVRLLEQTTITGWPIVISDWDTNFRYVSKVDLSGIGQEKLDVVRVLGGIKAEWSIYRETLFLEAGGFTGVFYRSGVWGASLQPEFALRWDITQHVNVLCGISYTADFGSLPGESITRMDSMQVFLGGGLRF